MSLTTWFVLISLSFVVLERIHPWRKSQPLLRKGLLIDVMHITFNGYIFHRLIYFSLASAVVVWFAGVMQAWGWWGVIKSAVMRDRPLWIQFIFLLLIQDFLKYCVHNLLHRVPFLWQFHKVHHSVQIMDWIGNMRYHWLEVVVYNSLLFLPMSFFGFRPGLFFYTGLIEIIIGHLNHSNLDVDIKWLRFIVNSPRMHIWHHAADEPQAIDKNFGIVFSLWDWIFRTAYMPANRAPKQLGFEGIENYPSHFFSQQLFPVSLLWRKSARMESAA